MVFGEKEPTGKLLIDGRHLENVEQFTYLGSNTTYDLDNMREVRTRLAKATAALKAMEKVWKSRPIIVISKLLKRHSKAKRRAPAYSRALRQIRGVFQRIVRGRLRSVFQRVRECVKSEVFSKE